MTLQCDAVFEGGGVRGIGHVGAACAIEKAGYKFANLVGSSAGAIVASLLAVGYTAEEIRHEMQTVDYKKFRSEKGLAKLGTAGKLISAYFYLGIYDADYFETWLDDLLRKKGKVYFGDIRTTNRPEPIYAHRLQVTASDVTGQRLLILPRDLADFGFDQDTFLISKAVRMSMSIPFFYKPFHLLDADNKPHIIVDGGLLSNYPIWLLDSPNNCTDLPTFGFKFLEDDPTCPSKKPIFYPSVLDYTKSLVSTALDAGDKQHISESKGDVQRTIFIPITVENHGKKSQIHSTDFGITRAESNQLFDNGHKAAEKFLQNWDFDTWQKAYRCK